MALLKMNDFEIECSLTYRTIPVKSKLNGQSFFTGDGRYHSISNHINRTLINLSLKDVQPKEWLRLKNFIEETICFQKVKVNVSVPHLDLGEGGVELSQEVRRGQDLRAQTAEGPGAWV